MQRVTQILMLGKLRQISLNLHNLCFELLNNFGSASLYLFLNRTLILKQGENRLEECLFIFMTYACFDSVTPLIMLMLWRIHTR